MLRTKHLPTIPFLALLLLCSISSSAQETFQYGGVERSYYLDVPENLEPGSPLVFALHGYTSNAWNIRFYSGWTEVSESEGIVVCYPDGTDDFIGSPHWNANLGISNTDDHGFLVALAEYLQETYELSPDCTYACGMSNGGFMSYSLACEEFETFKAIGSVTGAMSSYDFDNCDPSTVVPVIHLHGTSDFVVSYDNGVGDSNWGMASVPEIMNLWTDLMGTTQVSEEQLPNEELVDLTSVDFIRHYGSPSGQEFHHYRVNRGGHDWFGAWGSPDVESTQVIWEFFQSQCAGDFTSVEDLNSEDKKVLAFWDGETFGLFEDATVEAYDFQGKLLWIHEFAPKHSRWASSSMGGASILLLRTPDGIQSTVRIR